MHFALEDRAQRIARRIRTQLESVVGLEQRRIARELFGPYAGDREIDGIALYTDDGELVEGRGQSHGRGRYFSSAAR
jgi:hypothetical protein